MHLSPLAVRGESLVADAVYRPAYPVILTALLQYGIAPRQPPDNRLGRGCHACLLQLKRTTTNQFFERHHTDE